MELEYVALSHPLPISYALRFIRLETNTVYKKQSDIKKVDGSHFGPSISVTPSGGAEIELKYSSPEAGRNYSGII